MPLRKGVSGYPDYWFVALFSTLMLMLVSGLQIHTVYATRAINSSYYVIMVYSTQLRNGSIVYAAPHKKEF
jgi:hypothetical protein